jgi:alcohol dehydrogenase (cytochrome c)
MIRTATDPPRRVILGSVAAVGALLIATVTLWPTHAQSPPGQLASQQPRLHAEVRGGGLAPDAKLPAWPAAPSPLERIAPVSDTMLNNPPAGEWLTWRRSNDNLGFSPIRQITSNNVKDLRVAWSLTLPPGPNEGTPLVHGGVIFVHSYGDNVQALEATNGDELWHYSRKLPEGTSPSVKRNIALYGDKLYLGTSDVHVVALDVRTGNVVWDRAIAGGGSLTGGPLVAKGKVMQGIGGVGRPGGAYISALDAETGEEAWRFYTIARPDEPGGNSWNDLPLEKRSGGSIWTAGSYDRELNLAFFGPGPTYDTGPLRNRLNRPGITNDALYTDTTIALNPDTGKLVWYYQHMANDQWDLDWSFERQIVSLPRNGQLQKFVVTAGKSGVYDAVEAATGKYAFSFDMGLQNFITSIDPVTGTKTVNPNLVPTADKSIVVCPHAGGGRNWIPGSYNPESRVMFVPANETCMNLYPTPSDKRPYFSTGVDINLIPRPDSDGRYGRLQAISIDTRKTLWTQRQRAPQTTGVLATAGGLVFAGALDRWLTAYNDASGKVLWRTRLNDVPNSAPITYMVNGKQYVAMVVGYGGPQAASFPQLTPEIPLPVVRSSTIWVFELR